MSTLVSSNVAAARAGITYRQLDYWVRSGKVTPTINGRGHGNPRRWSESDITRLIEIRRSRYGH